jgi:hypothetical protein
MASESKGLVRYNAACKALAAAVATDEVKLIRDKADAMRAAARVAKNKQLETDAAEIRIRAERRLGELLAQQKATVGLNAGKRGQLKGRNASGAAVQEAPEDDRPTLAAAGIDHKLSSRAQKLAAVPQEEFEQELSEWRERVSSENSRVTTRLEKRGEDVIESTSQRAECNIPDSAIVSACLTCPTCGQRWPEGRPIHG